MKQFIKVLENVMIPFHVFFSRSENVVMEQNSTTIEKIASFEVPHTFAKVEVKKQADCVLRHILY